MAMLSTVIINLEMPKEFTTIYDILQKTVPINSDSIIKKVP